MSASLFRTCNGFFDFLWWGFHLSACFDALWVVSLQKIRIIRPDVDLAFRPRLRAKIMDFGPFSRVVALDRQLESIN